MSPNKMRKPQRKGQEEQEAKIKIKENKSITRDSAIRLA